jgi:hypothetical protein
MDQTADKPGRERQGRRRGRQRALSSALGCLCLGPRPRLSLVSSPPRLACLFCFTEHPDHGPCVLPGATAPAPRKKWLQRPPRGLAPVSLPRPPPHDDDRSPPPPPPDSTTHQAQPRRDTRCAAADRPPAIILLPPPLRAFAVALPPPAPFHTFSPDRGWQRTTDCTASALNLIFLRAAAEPPHPFSISTALPIRLPLSPSLLL